MTNFILVLTGNVIVNVFKSDAVIWWAAISRTRTTGEAGEEPQVKEGGGNHRRGGGVETFSTKRALYRDLQVQVLCQN